MSVGPRSVPLTMELLHLITMVQRHRDLTISEGLYYEAASNGAVKREGWTERTREYFNQIPAANLARFHLSHNAHSFEAVLAFKVTPEMNTTTYGELPSKFQFARF